MERPSKGKEQDTGATSRTCWNAGCLNEDTKRCARCRTARYCSVVCQQTHWLSSHKAECAALAEARQKQLQEDNGETQDGSATAVEGNAQSQPKKQRAKKKAAKGRNASPSSAKSGDSSTPSSFATTNANCFTIKAGAFNNEQELLCAFLQATPLCACGEFDQMREIRQRYGWSSPAQIGHFYPRDVYQYYYAVFCDKSVQGDESVPVNHAMELALSKEVRGDVMVVHSGAVDPSTKVPSKINAEALAKDVMYYDRHDCTHARYYTEQKRASWLEFLEAFERAADRQRSWSGDESEDYLDY